MKKREGKLKEDFDGRGALNKIFAARQQLQFHLFRQYIRITKRDSGVLGFDEKGEKAGVRL